MRLCINRIFLFFLTFSLIFCGCQRANAANDLAESSPVEAFTFLGDSITAHMQSRANVSPAQIWATKERYLNLDSRITYAKIVAPDTGKEERIAEAARLFTEGKEHFFFIGRGGDADIAAEASLKLKEISYIHSEAYAAGELKHGTLSLIEEGTPTAVIATDRALLPKTHATVREILARGGRVLTVTGSDCQIDEGYSLHLPPLSSIASPIASSTVLQLFAYHAAYLRGCAIDKPRNLAKSVTVE